MKCAYDFCENAARENSVFCSEICSMEDARLRDFVDDDPIIVRDLPPYESPVSDIDENDHCDCDQCQC